MPGVTKMGPPEASRVEREKPEDRTASAPRIARPGARTSLSEDEKRKGAGAERPPR